MINVKLNVVVYITMIFILKHGFNNIDILCKCGMSINPSQYKIHLICTYIRNNNDKLELEY